MNFQLSSAILRRARSFGGTNNSTFVGARSMSRLRSSRRPATAAGPFFRCAAPLARASLRSVRTIIALVAHLPRQRSRGFAGRWPIARCTRRCIRCWAFSSLAPGSLAHPQLLLPNLLPVFPLARPVGSFPLTLLQLRRCAALAPNVLCLSGPPRRSPFFFRRCDRQPFPVPLLDAVPPCFWLSASNLRSRSSRRNLPLPRSPARHSALAHPAYRYQFLIHQRGHHLVNNWSSAGP